MKQQKRKKRARRGSSTTRITSSTKPPVCQQCPACFFYFNFLHSYAKKLRTYSVVVHTFRNISTYRVCGPAFPLHFCRSSETVTVARCMFGVFCLDYGSTVLL